MSALPALPLLVEVPGDSPARVRWTARQMARLVAEAEVDPAVVALARGIVAEHGLGRDEVAAAGCLLGWLRAAVQYVPDPLTVETIAGARTTIDAGFGDCDDLCVALGALLRCVGLPIRWVFGAEPGASEFSHVWLEVACRIPGRGLRWFACDPSLPDAPFGCAPVLARVMRLPA